MKIKEKAKNYLKKHKKDIIEDLLIGAVVSAGAYAIYKVADSKSAKIFTGNVMANKEMDTIDLFVGNGSNKKHLWVFDVGEAQALAGELQEAIDILRPQG